MKRLLPFIPGPPLPSYVTQHLQPADAWPPRSPPGGGSFQCYLQSLHPLVGDFVPLAADVVIGRNASSHGRSDLTIEDPYISERHAALH